MEVAWLHSYHSNGAKLRVQPGKRLAVRQLLREERLNEDWSELRKKGFFGSESHYYIPRRFADVRKPYELDDRSIPGDCVKPGSRTAKELMHI